MPYLCEQEERREVGVHDVGEFFGCVLNRGLTNAGAHVVDQDV